MKLFYRGICYESQPSTLEVSEGEIGGTYRGNTWKVHKPKLFLRRQMPMERIYRGVTYIQ